MLAARRNCGISEADAERLAREIEHGSTHGASGLAAYHMLEERGGEVDDLQVRGVVCQGLRMHLDIL